MKGFAHGEYDRVELVYNRFKNAGVQILTTEQLLPLLPAAAGPGASETAVDYIIEPSKEKIVEELIPKAIRVQLYKAVLDSNASEHRSEEQTSELQTLMRISYCVFCVQKKIYKQTT